MTRRIPVRRGKQPVKKKAKKFGPSLSDLTQVQKGKELKDLDMCYHNDPNGYHPNTISAIRLKGISRSGKVQVVKWIHQGKIWIVKQ